MTPRFFMPVGGTGGGPSENPFRIELWNYIFKKLVLKHSKPKVALLTTPSQLCGNKIDIDKLIANYKNLEEKLDCTFSPIDELRFGRGEYDGMFDVLCVTCGNTAGTRERWKEFGCEEVIRQWYGSGIICAGYSAGFIVFYDWASTDSIPGPDGAQFGIMPGLGIIKGAAIPHADTQSRRIPDFQLSLKQQDIEPVLALGEEVMAVYGDETLQRLVSPITPPLACLVKHDSVEELNIENISTQL